MHKSHMKTFHEQESIYITKIRNHWCYIISRILRRKDMAVQEKVVSSSQFKNASWKCYHYQQSYIIFGLRHVNMWFSIGLGNSVCEDELSSY